MNSRNIPLLLILTVTLAACASSNTAQRPEDVAQPAIDIRLTSPIFFGAGTTAPVTLDIDVTNRAKVPLTLRRVELDSPGMVQYELYRQTRTFRETIEPGETKPVTIFATAVRRSRYPSEPLTVRAILELEAAGKVWREVTIQRTE